MSDADIGVIVRFVLVTAALVFTIIRMVRDRREHRRIEALFAANAAKYVHQRDGAERAR